MRKLIPFLLFAVVCQAQFAVPPTSAREQCLEMTFTMMTRESSKVLFNKKIINSLTPWVLVVRNSCAVRQVVQESDGIAELQKMGINAYPLPWAHIIVQNGNSMDGARRIGYFMTNDAPDTIQTLSLLDVVARHPSAKPYIVAGAALAPLIGEAILGRTPNSLENFHQMEGPTVISLEPGETGQMRIWSQRFDDSKEVKRAVMAFGR